jgi:cytidylate kinase
MVIAIDGPAGTGKSTVARAVADRLGFTYLDTGAMYRAVALAAGETGEDPASVAARAEIDVRDRVLLDERDVTDAIRTPEVTAATSEVAAIPAVREALIVKQREIVATGDWVAEGRDIGTVVAPDAAVKVFLTATPEERARRRAEQTGGDYATILADQAERDERDSSADRAIFAAPPDATPLDTTGLTIDDVIEQIATLVLEVKEIGA